MTEAEDFRAESAALYALVSGVSPDRLDGPTQFKAWTVNTVIGHLHVWNQMAGLQLTDPEQLTDVLSGSFGRGRSMRDFERDWLGDVDGPALLDDWRAGAEATADLFAVADSKARLKWVGPDMSARSSITARLMETWAHGQEVYDHLGQTRINEDRIRNIVVLGVNTFAWTYRNRSLPVPDAMPRLDLTAPSGASWTFGEAGPAGSISGPAGAFCQVVTQTRNVADTALFVEGDIAAEWMSIAQCFAGPPADPPRPGERFCRS